LLEIYENTLQKLFQENFKIIEFSDFHIVFNFKILISSGSKIQKIVNPRNGPFKIYINQRPVDGAANRAVLKELASRMGLSKSSIQIVKGLKSKEKEIQVQVELGKSKTMAYYKERWTKELISE
jgi:uncharacterized protein YggU (UPF0235/DUF167 family)